MPLGVSNYNWYLWHYLYDNYLQQIWSLFAVLFAFGGLVREKQSGTVLFSLSLPVSRRRWLFTRLLVAILESVALACFAILVVAIGSTLIHQSFSMSQLLSHTVLMVSVGLFAIALGNIFYTLFPGHYVSLIFILAVIGAPYLVLQNYMQHMRYLHRSTWLAYLDLGHAMAGPWQLTWSTVPWVTLFSTIFITLTLVAAAVFYGDRIDY
jgi:ABC-type transport system involved in multi-copper enzyme maturation permease subunit